MPGSSGFDRLSPGPATHISSHSFSASSVSLCTSPMQSEARGSILHMRIFYPVTECVHSGIIVIRIIKYSHLIAIYMDLTTLDTIRIAIGTAILLYVAYCLLNLKVWLRGPIGLTSKTFAWGPREENESIFMLHVIFGCLFGAFLVVAPFLF